MKSGRPPWYLTYYVWYLTKGSYVWSWPNNGGLYSDKELAKRHVLLPHKRTMSYRNFCLVLWCQQLSCCCYILSLSIAQTEIKRKRMFCCVQVSRDAIDDWRRLFYTWPKTFRLHTSCKKVYVTRDPRKSTRFILVGRTKLPSFGRKQRSVWAARGRAVSDNNINQLTELMGTTLYAFFQMRAG